MSLQDLSLWGWSKQQMGDGFASSNTRRVLDCAARWSLGWWRVQAPFPHLLFTHGQPDPSPPLQAPEEPNKIISLCSRWLPLPPKAFLSLFFFAALLAVISSLLFCLCTAYSWLLTPFSSSCSVISQHPLCLLCLHSMYSPIRSCKHPTAALAEPVTDWPFALPAVSSSLWLHSYILSLSLLFNPFTFRG